MKYLSLVFGIVFLIISCKPKEIEVIDSGYYMEKFRPQIHFSPEANWMNDPNGMVFYDGEYHLFYQYYPDSTVWGPMHWGHAVSKDMVHWEHLPIALYPDTLGYIFSGSAVIDWKNTSGLGENGQPPMVAIFTHHDPVGEQAGSELFQYQSIAYSNDKGRKWIKYPGNPVIPNPGIRDFRDPKVIWDADSEQWVMVFAAYDHVQFWGSKDLIHWSHLSNWGKEFGTHDGVWECPDLFPLTVESTGEKKWVLIQSINPGGLHGGSGTMYFIGEFDGKEFILDQQFSNDVTDGKSVWLDYGSDNYAGVTWSDIPAEDGRRLFLGWMSNWSYAQTVPTQEWRSAMTLPRVISLHREPEGLRLRSNPVKELQSIEIEKQVISGNTFKENYLIPTDPKHHLYKLELTFVKPEKGLIEIRFSNNHNEYISVGYNVSDSRYFIDRTFAGRSEFNADFAELHSGSILYNADEVLMTIFIDLSSIELFADAGRFVATEIFFPSEPYSKIEIIAENDDVELKNGSITKLKSIWMGGSSKQ